MSGARHTTHPSLHVRNAGDAHIIFEAVRLGILPIIRRRLSPAERDLLRSGEVFVWEEAEQKGGLERWTDGRRWSQSRMREPFLFYEEKVDTTTEEKEAKAARRALRSSTDPFTGLPVRVTAPSPTRRQDRPAKPNGLTKQTYSTYVLLPGTSTYRKWHLVAYFSSSEYPRLPVIEHYPELRNIRVPEGIYVSGKDVLANRRPGFLPSGMAYSAYNDHPHAALAPSEYFGKDTGHQREIYSHNSPQFDNTGFQNTPRPPYLRTTSLPGPGAPLSHFRSPTSPSTASSSDSDDMREGRPPSPLSTSSLSTSFGPLTPPAHLRMPLSLPLPIPTSGAITPLLARPHSPRNHPLTLPPPIPIPGSKSSTTFPGSLTMPPHRLSFSQSLSPTATSDHSPLASSPPSSYFQSRGSLPFSSSPLSALSTPRDHMASSPTSPPAYANRSTEDRRALDAFRIAL